MKPKTVIGLMLPLEKGAYAYCTPPPRPLCLYKICTILPPPPRFTALKILAYRLLRKKNSLFPVSSYVHTYHTYTHVCI
jgi:hypothetical protein